MNININPNPNPNTNPNPNINLSRLNVIIELFDNLILEDLVQKYVLFYKLYDLIIKIKPLLNYLITEYYFVNIIEFELKKKKIICKLECMKTTFYTFNIDNVIIEKIKKIIGITNLIVFPAFANFNNTQKYINEINEINGINGIIGINNKTSIKFYHKSETFDIKNNYFDEKIETEIKLDKTKIISKLLDIKNNYFDEQMDLEIKLNKTKTKTKTKLLNIKNNYFDEKINLDLDLDLDLDLKKPKLNGKKFYSIIDFEKSFISI